MSAETLRKAAALMRGRAEAVPTDGLSDWWFADEAPDLMHLHRRDRVQIASFGHPAVALAVADWLDSEADASDWNKSLRAVATRTFRAQSPHAVAVARAYLGSDA